MVLEVKSLIYTGAGTTAQRDLRDLCSSEVMDVPGRKWATWCVKNPFFPASSVRKQRNTTSSQLLHYLNPFWKA